MEAARRSLKAPTEFADLPVIPVFRPDITELEIEAVAATMRSGWIGPGPRTAEFEKLFAESVGAQYAISVSTGTAALLAAKGPGPCHCVARRILDAALAGPLPVRVAPLH